jgi:hypothetical protein
MLEGAMLTGAFSGWQRVRVHALLVGNRIDLRALYRNDSLTVAPLAIPAGERGMAALFRYGAVVMFNLQLVEEAAFLVNLNSTFCCSAATGNREGSHRDALRFEEDGQWRCGKMCSKATLPR